MSLALVANIDGDNARFGIYDRLQQTLLATEVFSAEKFDCIEKAIDAFLSNVEDPSIVIESTTPVCFAVASPAKNDIIKFKNSHWGFSKKTLASEMQWENFFVINDCEAIAYALTLIEPDRDTVSLHKDEIGICENSNPQLVVSSGTGLGVAAIAWKDDLPVVIPSEGGHSSFAPETNLERSIEKLLSKKISPLFNEELMSNRGIENIYYAIANVEKMLPEALTVSEVIQGGINADAHCMKAILTFCEVLGSFCGNAALMFGAKGGVFLSGEALTRMVKFLLHSDFMERFQNKCHYQDYLKSIPVNLITIEHPTLKGALAYLSMRID